MYELLVETRPIAPLHRPNPVADVLSPSSTPLVNCWMKTVAGKGNGRWALTLMATLICAPLPIAAQRRDIVLATTTSVRDAGLLEHLLPRFELVTGLEVRGLAVGSGQAMALGRQGEADVLILHDPVGERQFVEDGYGVEREALMHNQFVVVGPAADPAGVRPAVPASLGIRVSQPGRSQWVGRFQWRLR